MAGLAHRAESVALLHIPVDVDDGRRRAQQGAAQREFLSPRSIRQKAKLPDAHETAGQDVQQEAPGEFDGLEVGKEARRFARDQKWVSGEGAAAVVPAQRWRDPERDQRSDSQLTGLISTTPLRSGVM